MEKKSCFIIMPFSSTLAKGVELKKPILDYIYNEVIKLAVSEYQTNNKSIFTEISRYEENIGSIVSGIASKLNKADLVIADLTGLNPNVMYELGVRHTLKRGTIIITQDINTLASDLRDYTCMEYQFSKDTIEQKENYKRFKENLHKSITEIFTTDKFDSPVLSYLKGKEKYWREDELSKLKENIIISDYIYAQYETVRELLQEIILATEKDYLLKLFVKCGALISNLINAISDINISIEDSQLYEDIQAAKLLISDVQKKIFLTDYFATYMQPYVKNDGANYDSLKVSFFNEKYIDYFKLSKGEYCELSLDNIFSSGHFFSYFISGFENYLQGKGKKLGLTRGEINSLVDKL